MQVHDNMAATLLFDQVKALNEQSHTCLRCVYLHFAAKREPHNHKLKDHFLTSAIIELLGGDEGYIYLCEDGDVFILFEGALRPIVNKLGKCFKHLRPKDLENQPMDEICTIFDLSKYWDLFYRFTEAKRRHMDAIRIPAYHESHDTTPFVPGLEPPTQPSVI